MTTTRPTPLPGGTKRAILDRLLREPSTAQGLADDLAISGAAIRQHLAPLHEAGLVERSTGEPTTGRPTYVYRLSALGRRAYPKRYDVLAGELIEVLVERYGRAASLDLVRTAAERVARREQARLEAADDPERWRLLLAWLEEVFGWEAEAEVEGDGSRGIVVHQCPFHDVTGRHPEVCGTFFTTLVETLWGEPAVHRPIRDGTRCCALEVSPA